MTEQQEIFIKKLKITLIATLLPFSLALGASAIADHFQIRNNKQHLELLENNYVTREVMLIYVNELRETNSILKQDLSGNCKDVDRKLEKVNDEMDQLMREVYQIKQRSAKVEDNQ